jgi:hypothetical protein
MDGEPFLISTLVNRNCFATTLVDTGCLSYGLIDSRFATRHKLERIGISPRGITGFDAPSDSQITEVAVVSMDVDGHLEEQVFLYVVPRLASYDMILGMPWVKKQDVQINGPRSECMIMSTGTVVRNVARPQEAKSRSTAVAVSAASFDWLTRGKRRTRVEVFAASLADINKALTNKAKTDPRTKLPKHFHEFIESFSREKANELAPRRGEGVDHEIRLEKINRQEPKVP